MIDTGCVWGGALTALRLEDRWLAQVCCRGYQPVGEAA
ncbi:MAG: bis(5'-nucleosyl)-tetraphosphatase (symmetrical), partial [Betaproteobacteria bacterium]